MRFRAFVCSCALLATYDGAQAQTRALADATAEQTIRDREILWERALVLRQQVVIDAIVASDAMFVSSTGELMTKAQADADNRKSIVKASTITQMSVRVFGNVAVVIGTNVEQSEYAGQDTSGQYRWTDVFQKRGDQWVVVSAHSTRIEETPATVLTLPAERPLPADPRFAAIEGLSEDQVRARLGNPSLSGSSAGVTTWYYDTPHGTMTVFFYRGKASLARPK